MTKPLLRALAGEPVWPPPLWLMRQAGRYLPEYREVRAEAGSFIGLCTNPALAAEVTLQPVRRYGFDAAILFSDILMLPWALGHGLDFREGEGPVLPKLRDAAGIEALEPARVADAIAPILETVRRVRAALAETVALIGFAGGPFTVACYMVEGGGSRDFAAVKGFAYGEPALFHRLIGLLTESSIAYLRAQADAGAEALMIFDSWAGLLSPALFAAFVTGPTRRIVAALRESHPGVPVIGFPRLAGTMAPGYAAASGVDGLGMDTATDPSVLAPLVPARVALQGNLDPLAVLAGGAAMEEEARGVLAALRGRPAIFNLGHGIVPATPPEHVARLVELVRGA